MLQYKLKEISPCTYSTREELCSSNRDTSYSQIYFLNLKSDLYLYGSANVTLNHDNSSMGEHRKQTGLTMVLSRQLQLSSSLVGDYHNALGNLLAFASGR